LGSARVALDARQRTHGSALYRLCGGLSLLAPGTAVSSRPPGPWRTFADPVIVATAHGGTSITGIKLGASTRVNFDPCASGQDRNRRASAQAELRNRTLESVTLTLGGPAGRLRVTSPSPPPVSARAPRRAGLHARHLRGELNALTVSGNESLHLSSSARRPSARHRITAAGMAVPGGHAGSVCADGQWSAAAGRDPHDEHCRSIRSPRHDARVVSGHRHRTRGSRARGHPLVGTLAAALTGAGSPTTRKPPDRATASARVR